MVPASGNSLHVAIDAVALIALADVAYLAGNNERGHELEQRAISLAFSLGQETSTLPLMFERHAPLREAWETPRVIQQDNAQIDLLIAVAHGHREADAEQRRDYCAGLL